MLVKELIQELQKFNPEQEMVFSCSIESGRSLDSCSNGDWDLDVEDLDEDEIKNLYIKERMGDEEDWTYEEFINDDEDNEKDIQEFVKDYKPRVVFNISGECTDYQ
jgi:hypothetical protein